MAAAARVPLPTGLDTTDDDGWFDACRAALRQLREQAAQPGARSAQRIQQRPADADMPRGSWLGGVSESAAHEALLRICEVFDVVPDATSPSSLATSCGDAALNAVHEAEEARRQQCAVSEAFERFAADANATLNMLGAAPIDASRYFSADETARAANKQSAVAPTWLQTEVIPTLVTQLRAANEAVPEVDHTQVRESVRRLLREHGRCMLAVVSERNTLATRLARVAAAVGGQPGQQHGGPDDVTDAIASVAASLGEAVRLLIGEDRHTDPVAARDGSFSPEPQAVGEADAAPPLAGATHLLLPVADRLARCARAVAAGEQFVTASTRARWINAIDATLRQANPPAAAGPDMMMRDAGRRSGSTSTATADGVDAALARLARRAEFAVSSAAATEDALDAFRGTVEGMLQRLEAGAAALLQVLPRGAGDVAGSGSDGQLEDRTGYVLTAIATAEEQLGRHAELETQLRRALDAQRKERAALDDALQGPVRHQATLLANRFGLEIAPDAAPAQALEAAVKAALTRYERSANAARADKVNLSNFRDQQRALIKACRRLQQYAYAIARKWKLTVVEPDDETVAAWGPMQFMEQLAGVLDRCYVACDADEEGTEAVRANVDALTRVSELREAVEHSEARGAEYAALLEEVADRTRSLVQRLADAHALLSPELETAAASRRAKADGGAADEGDDRGHGGGLNLQELLDLVADMVDDTHRYAAQQCQELLGALSARGAHVPDRGLDRSLHALCRRLANAVAMAAPASGSPSTGASPGAAFGAQSAPATPWAAPSGLTRSDARTLQSPERPLALRDSEPAIPPPAHGSRGAPASERLLGLVHSVKDLWSAVAGAAAIGYIRSPAAIAEFRSVVADPHDPSGVAQPADSLFPSLHGRADGVTSEADVFAELDEAVHRMRRGALLLTRDLKDASLTVHRHVRAVSLDLAKALRRFDEEFDASLWTPDADEFHELVDRLSQPDDRRHSYFDRGSSSPRWVKGVEAVCSAVEAIAKWRERVQDASERGLRDVEQQLQDRLLVPSCSLPSVPPPVAAACDAAVAAMRSGADREEAQAALAAALEGLVGLLQRAAEGRELRAALAERDRLQSQLAVAKADLGRLRATSASPAAVPPYPDRPSSVASSGRPSVTRVAPLNTFEGSRSPERLGRHLQRSHYYNTIVDEYAAGLDTELKTRRQLSPPRRGDGATADLSPLTDRAGLSPPADASRGTHQRPSVAQARRTTPTPTPHTVRAASRMARGLPSASTHRTPSATAVSARPDRSTGKVLVVQPRATWA